MAIHATVFIAPPASLKTEIVNGLRDLKDVYFIDKLTEKTLVSGKQDDSGEDQSLLPRLTGAGKVLWKHYGTLDRAKALVALGELSGIGDTLQECEAYHRDRNEDWDDVQPYRVDGDLDALKGKARDRANILYVWEEPGGWEHYEI